MNLTHKRLNIFTLLFALFATVSSAQSTSYFVNGTYAGDARYNVKKVFDGSDDNLCWAAAASNVIDFWQQRNFAYLPNDVPRGQTQLIYSSDVFYTFVHSFRDGGGYESDGISWWLNGVFRFKFDYVMRTDPISAGNYYADWNWTNDDIGRMQNITGDKSYLGNLLFHSLENDYLMTADIYGGSHGTGAHAISLWGYEVDDLSGELIGLWIGDSDSQDIGNILVDVFWDDLEAKWFLTGDYAAWHIDYVSQFFAPTIPEPLYGAFAFGGVALALAVYRRRRRYVACSV